LEKTNLFFRSIGGFQGPGEMTGGNLRGRLPGEITGGSSPGGNHQGGGNHLDPDTLYTDLLQNSHSRAVQYSLSFFCVEALNIE